MAFNLKSASFTGSSNSTLSFHELIRNLPIMRNMDEQNAAMTNRSLRTIRNVSLDTPRDLYEYC